MKNKYLDTQFKLPFTPDNCDFLAQILKKKSNVNEMD